MGVCNRCPEIADNAWETELPCRYEGPVREMESGVDDDVMRHGSKSVGIEGYSHPLSCTRDPFDEKTRKEDSMPMKKECKAEIEEAGSCGRL